jgi:hypothetical protein
MLADDEDKEIREETERIMTAFEMEYEAYADTLPDDGSVNFSELHSSMMDEYINLHGSAKFIAARNKLIQDIEEARQQGILVG